MKLHPYLCLWLPKLRPHDLIWQTSPWIPPTWKQACICSISFSMILHSIDFKSIEVPVCVWWFTKCKASYYQLYQYCSLQFKSKQSDRKKSNMEIHLYCLMSALSRSDHLKPSNDIQSYLFSNCKYLYLQLCQIPCISEACFT